MNEGGTGERIGFDVDGETLRIRDALEQSALRLALDREPEISPALPELFPFPVDEAISFEAGSFSVPEYSSVSVRTDDGDFIAKLDNPTDLPRGSYCFDIMGMTKVFVRVVDVECSTTGTVESGPLDVEFNRPTTVSVGARSLHTRPEATITVPDDPAALAEAVSVLGSSIKEFSPERSWPTLRGYPPRIERGDELDIPSPLTGPDTGVEVIVRPEYADVYRLSTLSFYLGARMVVGDAPAIRLDTGYVEMLPTEGVALEDRAEELLRTWFFLDTLARTDGYVPSDRYEYREVGGELPFYPPNLADLSMSDRLMEYLEVDPATVAPYVPDWPTEAVLRPGPGGAELLPHLAHVLAPVRVRGAAEPDGPDSPGALGTSPWLTPGDAIPNPDIEPLPAGTSVLTTTSYENRLSRGTTSRGDVRIVAMTDSAERAVAIRRALSEPAVPEGVGEWEVLDRPDAETVAAVLSNAEVDIAYCGLPVIDGEIVASSGPVAITGFDDAAVLTVFEETTEIGVGLAAVDAGGLGSVVTGTRLTGRRIRSLVGLLAAGTSVGASVALSEKAGDDTAVRCIGDPGISVASTNILAMQVDSMRSESPNSHRNCRGSIISYTGRIGMEQVQVFERLGEMAELVGTERGEGPTYDCAQLLTLLEEIDSIVRLNGQLLLPSDELTESDIERMARRSLADGQYFDDSTDRSLLD